MLITPYGGSLVDGIVPAEERPELGRRAAELPSIRLSQRASCELELLSVGGFSPLEGFVGRDDYQSILETGRLGDGTVFPIPILLATDDVSALREGHEVALRDLRNDVTAVMTVDEIYGWDRGEFARSIAGTEDIRHPLVSEIEGWGRYLVSGKPRVLRTATAVGFADLRLSPESVRSRLSEMGRDTVVAFQTRNPIHRGHEEMLERAIQTTGGTLLLHPAVGMTQNGDVDHFTRVRTYMTIADRFGRDRVLLSLVPLAMYMAGPKEAILHAIIRRNYGASHFIIGRDHASPGNDSFGQPFYSRNAAQEAVAEVSEEIGVKVVEFDEFVYVPDERRYQERRMVNGSRSVVALSGTRMRADFLGKGERLPDWFVSPDVREILEETYPLRRHQGFCIWFTGLSGAGKSTTAEILTALLLEHGRASTLLDGDVVRTHLSQGLGFSKHDRDLNIRRIGFVASEVVRHGGTAICAAISPYRESRNQVRQMFGEGQFIEVFVNTPIEVCEQRDPKGMYRRARSGEIKDLTGVGDVYEQPELPEITLETVESNAQENAMRVVDHLIRLGFIADLALKLGAAS